MLMSTCQLRGSILTRVNFSLTDGDNLKFRISKRTVDADGTTPRFDLAQIVVAPEYVGELTSDAPIQVHPQGE